MKKKSSKKVVAGKFNDIFDVNYKFLEDKDLIPYEEIDYSKIDTTDIEKDLEFLGFKDETVISNSNQINKQKNKKLSIRLPPSPKQKGAPPNPIRFSSRISKHEKISRRKSASKSYMNISPNNITNEIEFPKPQYINLRKKLKERILIKNKN